MSINPVAFWGGTVANIGGQIGYGLGKCIFPDPKDVSGAVNKFVAHSGKLFLATVYGAALGTLAVDILNLDERDECSLNELAFGVGAMALTYFALRQCESHEASDAHLKNK